MRIRNTIVLIPIAFFLSCGTDSGQIQNEPQVQGIEIYDETGLHIGIWGNPSAPTSPTDQFDLLVPYPNPTSREQYMRFFIKQALSVEIWVSTALGPGQAESSYLDEFGVDALSNDRVVQIMDTQLDAGNHIITWGLNDESGNRIPSGFYRIYAEFGEERLWHDVFVGAPGESRQHMISRLNAMQ